MKRITLAIASLAASTFVATAAQAAITVGWVDNATSGAPIIQEFDLNTGAVLDEFTAPLGSNGRGIVQVGNVVYYTSAGTNGVYAYNFVTNTNLGTVFSVAGSTGLATMAYDGTNFWLGDYSGTNHVYEYSTTGTLLSTISLSNCTGFCDGLEYVNGTLISNRGDADNIYDVYSLTGTLLQSDFITGTAGGSTGIAFDGTDYYTDNVYGGGFNVYDSTGKFLRTTQFTGGSGYHLGEDLSVNYADRIDTGGGGVPEPATWAMFLLGFGAIGWTLRGRRQQGAMATTA